jgi:hypothetical protein
VWPALLYDLPPPLHRLKRKLGHVLNFYTLLRTGIRLAPP